MRAAPQQQDYHILHFVGHGSFNPETGKGQLILEKEQGEMVSYDSEQVANLWGAARTLQLVLLSSCLTAHTDPLNAYGGVAQALVRRGVPAVVRCIAG